MMELIGSIFTDTASLIVGDPCKLIASEDGPPVTYDEFMETCDTPSRMFELKGSLCVRGEADGWHDVYYDQAHHVLVIDLHAVCRQSKSLPVAAQSQRLVKLRELEELLNKHDPKEPS